MKLLILADIHGCGKAIRSLTEAADGCDAVILAGDITNFGSAAELEPILAAVEALVKPIFAVPGNCDLPLVDLELQKRGYSIHANVLFLDEFAFFGVGGSLPCPAATPNEIDESDFENILGAELALIKQKPMVLVTHQPAWGTKLDITTSGRHTGSRAVRGVIEKVKPVLAISGHMHEAFGTDWIGPTTLVNPGAFRNGRYAIVDVVNRSARINMLQLET